MTIGLLVALVVAAATIVSGFIFVGERVEAKVVKAITAHDGCAASHGDIRARISKSQEHQAAQMRGIRSDLRGLREQVTANGTKLELLLDGKGRRHR